MNHKFIFRKQYENIIFNIFGTQFISNTACHEIKDILHFCYKNDNTLITNYNKNELIRLIHNKKNIINYCGIMTKKDVFRLDKLINVCGDNKYKPVYLEVCLEYKEKPSCYMNYLGIIDDLYIINNSMNTKFSKIKNYLYY